MVNPLAVPVDRSAHLEDQFLLDVVRVIADGDLGACPPPPPGGRWIARAGPHGILNPVAATLRAAQHELPAAVRSYRFGAAARRLQMSQELARVASVLDAAGVRWAIVKGPVLSEVVYRLAGVRESTDLDLLVDPDDLRAAVRALLADGATVMGADWSQRTWANGSEVPIMTASGVMIDLHWHLLNRPAVRAAFRFDPQSILQRKVLRDLGGVMASTPDDLDLVLHVLLHACLDGCGRLRALLDIEQCVTWLYESGWTPTDLAQRARASRLEAPAYVALMATADQIDASVGDWTVDLSVTWWARGVRRRGRTAAGSALSNGLTRRLCRYTAPTTIGSIRGVLRYLFSRATRVVSPDRTQVSRSPTLPSDKHFEAYLARAGSARRTER